MELTASKPGWNYPQANKSGTNRKQTGDVLFHHIIMLLYYYYVLLYIKAHETLQKEKGHSCLSLPVTTGHMGIM